ncbi:MAG TPA: BON domain-containing protein [Pirellulales bacterium]|jgi:hypothetical protein
MFGRNEVSDKELSKTVNSRLARAGANSKIVALVNRGAVTLSGNLQYAAQRIPIVNTASRVAGVRQVIDQMQVVAKKSFSPPAKALVTCKPPVAATALAVEQIAPVEESAPPSAAPDLSPNG